MIQLKPVDLYSYLDIIKYPLRNMTRLENNIERKAIILRMKHILIKLEIAIKIHVSIETRWFVSYLYPLTNMTSFEKKVYWELSCHFETETLMENSLK